MDLYEKVYCARGDMENRIKECQLDLFADRTSAKTMRANQAALVVRDDALCAGLRAAPHCPQANVVRQGHLRHHPSQAIQDRRPGAGQYPPGQGRDVLQLSLPKRVRPRPLAAVRRGALTTREKPSRHNPKSACRHRRTSCARQDSPKLDCTRLRPPLRRAALQKPLTLNRGFEKSGLIICRADGGGARRRGWASVAPADNRRRNGADTRPRYCRAVRRNRRSRAGLRPDRR